MIERISIERRRTKAKVITIANRSKGNPNITANDEGLTLEKSTLKLFTEANLHYQVDTTKLTC